MWCIGTITGSYLANMEDVLDLYAEPEQEGIVRICFDERPCQLIENVLTPIAIKPNATEKEHQEYKRNGVCNVLLAYNIDTGQRHLQVTDTKTKTDYSFFMQSIVEQHYANQTKIKVVQDNYSTHSYGAFYENLPLEQARQLKHKLEFHFTPKHASWLNMAEIEFSALSRQCLDRRIATKEMLEKEALIWEKNRNANAVKVNWSFTTENARIKLKNRYQEITKIDTQN